MTHRPASSRYSSMSYQRAGRSGLKLPRLSLGLWHNFGANDAYDAARAMVVGAFDRGITHFDLANNYGPPPGSAEVTFGKILGELGAHRDELIISTKAGYQMWPGPYGDYGSRKYLLSSLDQSLSRLKLAYVDIFYHHRPDPETPLEETMGALAHAVKSGKALYAGISNYPPEQTRVAARVLRELGTPCLIHQPSYSMLNRWIEPELLPTLQTEGIGCIVFSPLGQGLLSDRYLQGLPKDSRAVRSGVFLTPQAITDPLLARLHGLNALARQRGQTLAQMALAWVLRNDGVTSALIGASRLSQVEDSLGALNQLAFTNEELQQVEEILAAI